MISLKTVIYCAMKTKPADINRKLILSAVGGFFLFSGCASESSKEQQGKKLNIVFFLADDLRWNSLGCMGNRIVQTGNIDQLSKEGVRFSNACVTTSISMVSRANLLTGQYMSRHGIREFGVPLGEDAFSATYPSIIRKAGYWTGYVGKYGVGKIRESDFDFSREYEVKHWFPEGNGDSIHVTQRNLRDALTFLGERPKEKPFLLTLGFFAVHAQDNHPDQYRYQPESEKFYQDLTIPVPETASDKFFKSLPWFLSTDANEGRIRWHWRFDTPEKYQKYMKAYYRMLTEMDIAIGEIVKELKKQGVYENTLIVFMGDNGYFHGEHGLADKWYPYEESIRVPLIVLDPRISSEKAGTVDENFVLNIDIAPTLVAAAGQKVPEVMQGSDFSVLYLNRNPGKWREDFFYEHPYVTNEERIPSSEALVTNTDKYIWWPHYKTEEYFDLLKDPLEKQNMIGDPAYAGRISDLKKRFELLRAEAHL